MGGLGKRTALTLVVAAGQLAILAVFVAIMPRFAPDAAGWAANYFMAVAVTTPIFMFFGFELRKITAAHDSGDVAGFNRLRLAGAGMASVLSMLCFPLVAMTGFADDLALFVGVVLFRLMQAMNDQITANYEHRDEFVRSAVSASVRVPVFLLVALPVGWLISPTTALFAGSLALVVVWFAYDRKHGSIPPNWAMRGRIPLNGQDLLAGTGAALISLNLSLPRFLAAALFGQDALNILGVGQALNRGGQTLAQSSTQALIAFQKIVGRQNLAKSRWVLAGVQAVIAVGLAILMPLWAIIFDYVAHAPMFTTGLLMLFVFGFFSQINYLAQSMVLLHSGAGRFAASPLIFIVLFGLGAALLYAISALTFTNMLVLLIVARVGQFIQNSLLMRS